MDWSSFLPNIISTLIGALVAFLLGFIAFIVQDKITKSSIKSVWNKLILKEFEELKQSLKMLKEEDAYSFIRIPIMENFLNNPAIQQLFSFSCLSELLNVYCKIQNYNKYVEINLLNPKTFDDDFIKEKINIILKLCDKVQEIKNGK